jgi:hypothetical protein
MTLFSLELFETRLLPFVIDILSWQVRKASRRLGWKWKGALQEFWI